MEFDPIILRYDGLEAEDHMIDLAQVGQSIQGAAQLIGVAATIATTGQYAKRASAMTVRVYAGIPQHRCWELPAIIVSTLPATAPYFPAMADLTKSLVTKAVTEVVGYAVKKVSGISQPTDIDRALDSVDRATAELGLTTRHALDAIVRMSEQNRPAVRSLVSPVGQSCGVMRVGAIENGAISITPAMREAIDAPDPVVIGDSGTYEILISECDWKNRSCKFSLRGDEDPNHRIAGDIGDPSIQLANNPYSEAFASQRWITVLGKPQLIDGELSKLVILDAPNLLAR